MRMITKSIVVLAMLATRAAAADPLRPLKELIAGEPTPAKVQYMAQRCTGLYFAFSNATRKETSNVHAEAESSGQLFLIKAARMEMHMPHPDFPTLVKRIKASQDAYELLLAAVVATNTPNPLIITDRQTCQAYQDGIML